MPSVKNNFNIKYDDVGKIQESILKLGNNNTEEVLNEYIHNSAANQIIEYVTKEIPVSKRGIRHARFDTWWEQENNNLSVGIANSLKGKRGSSFYYLYYVATGTGTSKRRGGTDFMEIGLDRVYPSLIDGIVAQLEKKIESEMKV